MLVADRAALNFCLKNHRGHAGMGSEFRLQEVSAAHRLKAELQTRSVLLNHSSSFSVS
jgi:hypothetical protein